MDYADHTFPFFANLKSLVPSEEVLIEFLFG